MNRVRGRPPRNAVARRSPHGADVSTGFLQLDRASRLLQVRRGTARLAHLVDVIPNAALDAPSLLPSWRRRKIIAHVATDAAALDRAARSLLSGQTVTVDLAAEVRHEETSRACTLGDDALRNLFTHTIARLDRAWADVPDSAWETPISITRGGDVPFSHTLWMRAREVWVHAVDLSSGGGFSQMPPELLIELVDDVERAWRRRGLDLGIEVAPGGEVEAVRVDDRIIVRGPLPLVARWSTGRLGDHPLRLDDGRLISPPPWL